MTDFILGTAWTAFVAGVGIFAGMLWRRRRLDQLQLRTWMDGEIIRLYRAEVAELSAERNRRLKPLREANARRHEEALERKNQAKARTNALHAELRELTERLI